MIIRSLQILTEYISIILCIHRVSGKKFKFSWDNLAALVFYVILVFAVENLNFGKLMIYAYFYIYIRIKIVDTWKKAVKPFCIMMCTMPMLQLLLYAVISYGLPNVFNISLVGTAINLLIIVFFFIWREKYLHILMDIITKFKKVIFFILLIILFKTLIAYYVEYKMINAYSIDQILICFLIVVLMLILWINSENEKKHKAEELRMYELYTKTFEEAVTAIRTKQHEFDNHINAIKCMRYTIHDMEELFDEQDKYCDQILQDNKYNKLLKLEMSPILAGYLYSKFTTVSAQDINIEYEIQDIAIEHIAISDMIEIIGILFDNAVEALGAQGDKEMEVKLQKVNDAIIISVANISGWKTNSEIEKFFEYGYSTKGQDHGIGLYRANTLARKYKTNIQVENITKNNVNYLCFKILFE